nr:hypothetical protein [Gammaproteobacteria bacterium]
MKPKTLASYQIPSPSHSDYWVVAVAERELNGSRRGAPTLGLLGAKNLNAAADQKTSNDGNQEPKAKDNSQHCHEASITVSRWCAMIMTGRGCNCVPFQGQWHDHSVSLLDILAAFMMQVLYIIQLGEGAKDRCIMKLIRNKLFYHVGS